MIDKIAMKQVRRIIAMYPPADMIPILCAELVLLATSCAVPKDVFLQELDDLYDLGLSKSYDFDDEDSCFLW